MRVVIVGATGSLGRALAEAEAFKKRDLLLVATDPRDLEALESDLKIRYGCKVETQYLDFGNVEQALKLNLEADRYYFPIGYTIDGDTWGLEPQRAMQLLMVNVGSIAAVVSQLILIGKNRPIDIVGFGSIAETRGRGNNVYYSMAKRALTSLFESLLHSSSNKNLRPFLFQIGYMNSQMSLGKKLLFPVAEPDHVAEAVVGVVDSGSPGIRYYPFFWKYVCILLRLVPWFLYRRLKF